MILYWTTTEEFGSRIIRWGRKEDCSHFAVNFFEAAGPMSLVVDSRLSSGVDCTWRETFLEKNKVLHALHWGLTHAEEMEIYVEVVHALGGAKYDKEAVFGLGASVLIERTLGVRDKFYQWDNPHRFFCVEVFKALRPLLAAKGLEFEGRLDNMTPHEFYEKLVGKAPLVDVSQHYVR